MEPSRRLTKDLKSRILFIPNSGSTMAAWAPPSFIEYSSKKSHGLAQKTHQNSYQGAIQISYLSLHQVLCVNPDKNLNYLNKILFVSPNLNASFIADREMNLLFPLKFARKCKIKYIFALRFINNLIYSEFTFQYIIDQIKSVSLI